MAENHHHVLDSDVIKRYQESVFVPWVTQDTPPLHFKQAQGVHVELASGQKLIDMKSQSFSANLGHKHPGMIKALVKAAENAQVFASDAYCETRLKLAEDLRAIAPQSPEHKLTKTFFTVGGAEANENAIKIARMVTGRHKVVTRYRSYHGATLATMNFSGDYRRIPVDNAISGVVRFPDPYPRGSGQNIDTVRLLEEIIEIEGPETICAVLLEGITGANGVFLPPTDYWPRIRKLCDQHGILLIADEVFSGFFRCGSWFAVNHFGITPDIITMSKGLTAGYAPLGAVLVTDKIADYFSKNTLWCGLTAYGHHLSCSAGVAAIHHYREDGVENNVKARGLELKRFLDSMQGNIKIMAETRAMGLLAAIDLKKGPKDERPLVPYRAQGDDLKFAKLLGKFLKEEGVLAQVRFGTLLIAPPLIITQGELKTAMDGIGRALGRLEKEVS